MNKYRNPKRVIKIGHFLIKNEKMIGIKFSYNEKYIQLVKLLPGVYWSEEYDVYLVKNNKTNLDLIFSIFKGHAWIDSTYFFGKKDLTKNKHDYGEIKEYLKYKKFDLIPQEYIDKLIERRYALNTMKSYICCFDRFVEYFKDTPLIEITYPMMNDYILQKIKIGISVSQQNQIINAIKFYYEHVLGMPNLMFYIDRPKKPKKLPEIFSKEEIKRMLELNINLKHHVILALLYSTGLRRSELLNLELTDIKRHRMQILVRDAKGNKDRYTLLSKTLLSKLEEYYKKYRPKKYVFEGIGGRKYSATSVLSIIKRAARNSGIHRNVTCHMFRHSFATHLLEDGVSLRYIQQILGHNSSKTTEIYTQVANNILNEIPNPLDSL